MGAVFWYFGLLAIGWGLIGAGIWFLSQQMERYNPPIPALIWLIGIILAAHLLSLGKATFVPAQHSGHPFFVSADALERGWPYRWYGFRSILTLMSPYYLLFNTIWWTISLGGWSYLTLRFLAFVHNRCLARLFLFGSIVAALMSAYYLPFLFPALNQ
jgi:hypothetical protein